MEMTNQFTEWMDEQGYIPLNGVEGEYYECPGCHVWHINSIRELYEEKTSDEPLK